MILSDKSDISDPRVPTVREGSSRGSDAQSVMTQEPPPYTEASATLLEGPASEVIPSGSRSPPASGPSNYPPRGHPAHPQSNSLLVPGLPPRSRAHSFGTPHEQKRKESEPGPQPRPVSQHFSSPAPQQQLQQYFPPSPQPSPPRPTAGPLVQRFPQSQSPPRANPMFTPPLGGMADPNAPPAPRPELARRCNYLAERNDSSIRGLWHIDTALAIPETLRPPMSDFHGVWNEMDKKSVKTREKEKKKREGGGWGRKKVVDTTPPKPLLNEGVMPNLMLMSKNGSVQGEVNVVSGDGAVRQAVVVAESLDGSVKLSVNASPEQPLRIFAISMDGSVRVKIPTTFEGAISMTALDGTVHISDGVKARLMTFSSTNKSARCYLGDWQAANFGAPSPSASPSTAHASRPHITSSPTIQPPPMSPPTSPHEPEDPFKTWAGPLAHLHSRDGSVHLSFIGEDTSSMFSKAMKSLKNGLLGTGNEEREEGVDSVGGVVGVDSRAMNGTDRRAMNAVDGRAAANAMQNLPLPRGVAMQAYRPQAQAVLQHLALRYPAGPRAGQMGPGPGHAHGRSASGPVYGDHGERALMPAPGRGTLPPGREYAPIPSEASLFQYDPRLPGPSQHQQSPPPPLPPRSSSEDRKKSY